MTTQVREQPAAAPAKPARLLHFYVPWSFPEVSGSPPSGARALCGYVRAGDDGKRGAWGQPDACVVCHDLRERTA